MTYCSKNWKWLFLTLQTFIVHIYAWYRDWLIIIGVVTICYCFWSFNQFSHKILKVEIVWCYRWCHLQFLLDCWSSFWNCNFVIFIFIFNIYNKLSFVYFFFNLDFFFKNRSLWIPRARPREGLVESTTRFLIRDWYTKRHLNI